MILDPLYHEISEDDLKNTERTKAR